MSKSGGQGASRALEQVSQETFELAKPTLQETFAQGLEALQTGGVGAQIPIIQRSVEAARAALSGTQRSLEEGFATVGISGQDPFAQGVLAETQQRGEFDISQIPTQGAQQAAGVAQQIAQGFPSVAVSGLGTAAGVRAQRQQNELEFLSSIFGAAAAGPTACWVADLLYGEGSLRAAYARSWVQAHDNWFTRLYRRRGQDWAAWLGAHPWAQPLARPIWGAMVRLGRRQQWSMARG